tara:strand:+ start:201 stop:494 length:294 start_codon:yes stop_codon:yes gene_type:complete
MTQAAELTGHQKRFIGDSGTAKPAIGDDSGKYLKPNDVPPGSSYFETDTGRMFRYEDGRWAYSPELTQGLIHQALQEIAGHHARTNELLEQILAHLE